MQKVKISDIAKKLNTTTSTVSRALAGNKRISLKTRELVMKTAKEMGYQPNAMAAALRRGKSDTIGIIVPRINRYFFGNLISGVEEILTQANYKLIICQSSEEEGKEQKAIQTMLQNQVGGILISLADKTKNFEHLQDVTNKRIPIIQIDRVSEQVESPRITNDNFNGAYLATKHLIKSGYKHIGHLGGEQSLKTYKQRYQGYLKAMTEHQLPINEDIIKHNVITRELASETIVKLSSRYDIDAVFCAGDYAALGVLDGLKTMNINVPDMFGVCGFANEPFAELISPQLSSVEQNAYEMGCTAAHTLLKLIDKKSVEQEQTIATRLIVRGSSKRSL